MEPDHGPDSELFAQVQELYKDVDSTLEFVCGVNEIICTTIPAIALLALLGCFEIAQITVGVRYLEQCPAEPRVPIFLFVGGCFGMLKVIQRIYIVIKLRKHSEFQYNEGGKPGTVKLVDFFLYSFLLCWHVAGAVWTMSIWFPHFESPMYDPDNYCEQTAYIFAVISLGVFAGAMIIQFLLQGGLAVCYKYTTFFEDG